MEHNMVDMPYHEHIEQPAFMVICEDECDQICGTKAEAQSEARDLRKMGFENVRVKGFKTWHEAHQYEDELRERP